MSERTRRRRWLELLGVDRSRLPRADEIAAGPLRPLTIPNIVDYLRLAALAVFVVLAVVYAQPSPLLASLFAAIGLADFFDGFLARLTGQFSRLGMLLDPVIDRLLTVVGGAVALAVDALPWWLVAVAATRELATVTLARYALARGLAIEVNTLGRVAVAVTFLGLAGALWSAAEVWTIVVAIGVAISLAATGVYVLHGLRRLAAQRHGRNFQTKTSSQT